jgi:hypothetical protein
MVVGAPPVASRSRAARLADVLTSAPDAALAATDLAAVRDDLGRTLPVLAAELPEGEHFVLDAFKVLVAHRHPDRCGAYDQPFTPSPRACRRTVGLLALNRCVRGFSPGPTTAVAEVLTSAIDDASGDAQATVWWAPWYRSLRVGARAAVHAEAVTWTTQLLTALDWARVPGPPVIGGRDDRWQCPGARRLSLKGRADVRVLAGGRPALLVMGAGRCRDDWRVLLGFSALVGALGRNAAGAPCRVVGIWPESGQVRVLPVDAGVLRASADAVVGAVATWVDTRLDAAAPATASRLQPDVRQAE